MFDLMTYSHTAASAIWNKLTCCWLAKLFLCRKRALAALCLGLLHGEDEERPGKRNRKVYMRQWISRREEKDVFHQLIRELEVGDVVAYKEFFRMTKEQFCFLLGKILR